MYIIYERVVYNNILLIWICICILATVVVHDDYSHNHY